MKNTILILVCVAFGFPFAVASATAKTEWPSFQAGLKVIPSKSSAKAVLPPGIKISSPDASLTDNKAKFSGLWVGWMCRKQSCDAKLAIETVTSIGAEGVLAIADDSSGKWTWKATYKFDGNELITKLSNGDAVALHLRSDGNLDIKKTKSDGSWVVGILGRTN